MDDEKRECSECHKMSYTVRRRVPLDGAPALCDNCFAHVQRH